MGQVNSGLRVILSDPHIYEFFQNVMGMRRGCPDFIEKFVRPQTGSRILDVGCGPATILNYLPQVEYWGFDISQKYIEYAKGHFGARGKFFCQELQLADLANLPSFDIVFSFGLLHHLDDTVANDLLCLAHRALRPGGRLITVDPVIVEKQNSIARFFVRRDRGQNVRRSEQYCNLSRAFFQEVHGEIMHHSWVPYTHFVMECTRA